MIDQRTVERILDTADIVDVVSDFVALKKRGANWVGLCPFHNDRNPSFYVSRAKGFCKCFSCGEGGSPVNFIMKHENISYVEALRYLAKKYNIEIEERELTDEERAQITEKESMYIINEFAMNYDAGNLSTYVYKELGGKLQLAVWDFNNAFDNYQGFRTKTDALQTADNSWFERLWQDPSFRESVCRRYQELRESTLSEEHIFARIAAYEQELEGAAERNFVVWGYSFEESLLVGSGPDGGSRNLNSYEEAKEQLKNTIRERLKFLDAELGGDSE